MEKERSEQELLSVVAYLYYYADLNQTEIANRLFISRSTVSRLIKKARSSGVVELKINEPWQRNLVLEDGLKTALNISGARVLSTDDGMSDDTALTHLSEMVSFYISTNAQNNTVCGVSWGNTFSHIVNSIVTSRNIRFTVVPIMGSMTWPRVNPESTEFSYRFSKVYGAKYVPLAAPLYAGNDDEHSEFLSKTDVAAALDTARSADIVLTSVASLEDVAAEGMIDSDTIGRLRELGCVGRVGGHLYDIGGTEIDGSFKDRHIGLSMQELRKVDNVLCVANRASKAEALYGAVKAGVVDTLFITDTLATAVLETAAKRRI